MEAVGQPHASPLINVGMAGPERNEIVILIRIEGCNLAPSARRLWQPCRAVNDPPAGAYIDPPKKEHSSGFPLFFSCFCFPPHPRESLHRPPSDIIMCQSWGPCWAPVLLEGSEILTGLGDPGDACVSKQSKFLQPILFSNTSSPRPPWAKWTDKR